VPVKRKILFAVALSWLVLLASTQLYLNKLANANFYGGEELIVVAPLVYPSITILSPTENINLQDSNTLTIAFEATIESGNFSVKRDANSYSGYTYVTLLLSAYVYELFYKLSWQSDTINVSSWDYSDPWNPVYFIHLTGIPDGYQTITIIAYGKGDYPGTVPIPREYPWDPDFKPVCYYFESVSNYTFGFTDGIFSSEPVNISVGSPSDYVPTPSPTASPSPSPEPTATPSEKPQQTGQDMAGAIFAVISIGVFLGLLFYLIKRK